MGKGGGMTVKIKICGLTNLDDTLDAIELGADYLGFNFYPDSKHYIDPESCQKILEDVPFTIQKVGVFVNADPQYVIDVATDLNLDLIQFNGDETPDYCNQFARPTIKALQLKDLQDLKNLKAWQAKHFLIKVHIQNAYGDNGGLICNWNLAREVKNHGLVFLSGNLTPENVEMAIASVQPFAVEGLSGIEFEPGRKDFHKMEEFIKRVRRVL